ncbi:Ig-like domain-containing protein, partial [Planctomycetota bacterium]
FTYTVSDGNGGTDTATVTVTVSNVNQAPVLDAIGNQTVAEGQALEFTVTATDSDNDALTFAAADLPTGATFDPATQAFDWTPTFDQAGNYTVLFVVTDDGTPPLSDSEQITITVGNVNRPPVLDPIGSKSVDEAATLEFTVTATDSDGDALTFSAANLPAGAAFDEATQLFSWTPTFDQAGNYTALFTVTDSGTPPESDSEQITITVGNVNRPPVLGAIGNRSVQEDEALSIIVTATDPDGDALAFSASGIPTGATFDPATQVFDWTPAFDQAGSYQVTFTVVDNGTPSATDSEQITITVGNVNRPPILGAIGNRSVQEGELLEITVTATDPDGDALTYAAADLPAGAAFDPATQTFSWTPAFDQAGTHSVFFLVGDSGTPPENDSEQITITVGNVNRPPIAEDQDAITDEDTPIALALTATDPDDDAVTCAVTAGPAHGTLSGVAPDVTYTPAADFNGLDTFTYTVDDGNGGTDTAAVTITVNPVNDEPTVSASADPMSGVAPCIVQFAAVGDDIDGDALSYSWTFGDGGTSDEQNPQHTYTGAGTYTAAVTASDGSGGTASASLSITITAPEPVNHPPVATDATAATAFNTAVNLQLDATDADGDDLTFAIIDGPSNGVLSGFSSLAGTVTYTPDTGYAGIDTFTFVASDGLADSNTAVVMIDVSDALVSILSVSTGQPYSLATAQIGAFYYIDRSYSIVDLSPALDGVVLVRTANADKRVTTDSHLTLLIGQDAVVSVCYDNRATVLPSWLEDGSWTFTDEYIAVNDKKASPLNVYEKTVPAGELTLGGNLAGGARGAKSNYVVIVRPAGQLAKPALKFTEGPLSADAWNSVGDTDGDGLLDAFELLFGLDQEDIDTDADGNVDETEQGPDGRDFWDIQTDDAWQDDDAPADDTPIDDTPIDDTPVDGTPPAPGGGGGGGGGCFIGTGTIGTAVFHR